MLQQYVPNPGYSVSSGVHFAAGEHPHYYNFKPYNTKQAVEALVEYLKGWSGLKGEAEANKSRSQVGAEITQRLSAWMRRQATYGVGEAPEIKGLNIYGDFRTNQRWESYAEWEQEEGVSKEGAKFTRSLENYLGDLMKNIKWVSVDYNEKGWWSVNITLK